MIATAKLELKATDGKTPDASLNASGAHHEIPDLSGSKLCVLLSAIAKSDFQIGRDSRRTILTALLAAERKFRKIVSSTSITSKAEIPSPASVDTSLVSVAQQGTAESVPVSAVYKTSNNLVSTPNEANTPLSNVNSVLPVPKQ